MKLLEGRSFPLKAEQKNSRQPERTNKAMLTGSAMAGSPIFPQEETSRNLENGNLYPGQFLRAPAKYSLSVADT